ncbi:MAG: hypothetical protein WCC26_15955, partial [Terracidiphilus sp.]
PDTYLFWDDLHPTTRGHNILAIAAGKLLTQAACSADAEPREKAISDLRSGCANESEIGFSGSMR